MGTQEYRANYRAALHEASSELKEIYREFEQLQLRKEQIEDVLSALEPFVPSISPVSYEAHRPVPVQAEPARFEPEYEIHAPVAAAVPVKEPVAPAPFAPVPEIIVDPIQSRINRALGLAVA
jgi:hypothetical protein